MKIELSKEQAKHYESIKWLISEGQRGSGRTYLMALAFVEKSIYEGGWVRIFDHTPYEIAQKQLLMQIDNIVSKMDGYNLQIRGLNNRYPEIWVFKMEEEENTQNGTKCRDI
jgi:hypothetical protein